MDIIDLEPNVQSAIEQVAVLLFESFKEHWPYEFYQKVGFTIVGVLPDANGPGKPDIFMAKSVRPV